MFRLDALGESGTESVVVEIDARLDPGGPGLGRGRKILAIEFAGEQVVQVALGWLSAPVALRRLMENEQTGYEGSI